MNLDSLPVFVPEALTILSTSGLVVALLALLLALIAWRRERKLAAHYAAVMTGANGANVAAALEAFVVRLGRSETRIEQLEGRAEDIDGRLRLAVQRVHLMRYSAFEGAGGDQSFALAMLDDSSDGIVMSGLYGRSGMRVYAKPVAGGRSTHGLTTEEERAIAEASKARQNG
jgi:hypothetical protein